MGSRHEVPQPTGPKRNRHALRSQGRGQSFFDGVPSAAARHESAGGQPAPGRGRTRRALLLVPFLLSAVIAGMGAVVAEAAVRGEDVRTALPLDRLPLERLQRDRGATQAAPSGTVPGRDDDGASRGTARHPAPLPTVDLAELLSPVEPPTAPAQPVPTPSGAPTTAPPVTAAPPTVPARGDGVITPVDVPPVTAAASGRVVTYSVEAEGGLGADTAELAAVVSSVLADSRGWQTVQGISLRPVPAADVAAGAAVDIRVTLASPRLTDELCAPLTTAGEVSCWNGRRAVLNAKRWALGAPSYGTDLAGYRQYLVNHEVGHGLGNRHASCPSSGAPAPVMVQQTISLEGCTAWPWPTPP